MLRLAIFLILQLLAIACLAQPKDPEPFPPSRMVTNRVTAITATAYKLTVTPEGKTKADTLLSEETYLLDAEGREVEHTMWMANQAVTKAIFHRYDSIGRKVTLREDVMDSSGHLLTRTVYVWLYEGSMSPLSKFQYLADTAGRRVLQGRIGYAYDEEGRLSQEAYFKGMTAEQWRYAYRYPDSATVEMDVVYPNTPVQPRLKQWKVDGKGQPVALISQQMGPTDLLETNKQVTWHYEYRYDDLGLLREKTTLCEERNMLQPSYRRSAVALTTYQYSPEGLLQEEIHWTQPDPKADFTPYAVVRYDYAMER